ncbi:MAG: Calx-beta domain-containing protein [Pirellulaceae bacterium]
MTITGSEITDNVANGAAGSGGGILNSGGTVNVSGTLISGNSANRAGGGIEATAGSVTNLSGVSLDGNTAGPAGSAAPGNGGGLHITGDGDATITGGTVNDNFAASEGGGLWNGIGVMTVDGTTISGNSVAGSESDQGGGGVFNAGGMVDISDATISDNLASGGTVAALEGGQEVPAVTTAATGTAAFQFNAVTGTFDLDLFVTGLELTDTTAAPELTAAHIHVGAAGAEGPVILNLLGSESFVEVDGGLRLKLNDVALPAANVADLARGNLYFNVHSSANAGGEIRGQLVLPTTMGSGGGVLNDGGTVTITDTPIFSNIASRAGGGIEATDGSTTTLTGVNLDNNIAGPLGFATPGNGGGLHISGAGNATITGGTVNDNFAAREGGGLWNGGGTMSIDGTPIGGNVAAGAAADDGGGGIFNNGGTLVVANSTITDNVANGASGSGGGVFNLDGSATITDTTISGNTANRAGGGIEDNSGTLLTLSGVQLTGNEAGDAPGNGGGIHLTGDGTVRVVESLVSENFAANEGGGLWNSAAGTLEVTRSTVADNRSPSGAGIFNDGAAGDVSVTNSTVANNFASVIGGGIASEGGAVTIESSTIAYNSAATGGGISATGGSVTSANSLVAENAGATGPDVAGTIVSAGNNLIGDSAGATISGLATSDFVDVPAGIGILADNSGLTPTIALVAGSLAIDASATTLTVDQRGVARPQNAAADIGAFESDFTALPTISIAATDADKAEGDVGDTLFTFTLTRSGDLTGALTIDYAVVGSGNDPASANDFTGGVLPTGTATFADQDAEATITISVAADANVEPDETFTLTISNPSSPVTLSNTTALGTIQNDDADQQPTPTLSISAADGDEFEGNAGSASFSFTITRGGDTTGTASVNYVVTGSGTNAAAADDFAGAALPSGTVNFADGETSQTITINVAGDTVVEDDETFTVTLSGASSSLVIQTAAAIGTIRNDDVDPVAQTPTLSIVATDGDEAEGDSGTATYTFAVTRSGDSTGAASVNYAVTGLGTNAATADDFVGGVFPLGTVDFADGETSQTISISVAGDSAVEDDETFTVTLSGASSPLVIQTAAAIGTIRNDDVDPVAQTPTLSIAASDGDEAEGDSGTTTITFTVMRSGSTTGSTSVDFAITGSATNPATADDFVGGVLPSGTITFADGVTTQTISVGIVGDTNIEPDEGFVVTLSGATGNAAIQAASASGIIRNDDGPVDSAVLSVAAADADKAEGDIGTTPLTFTVTRSGTTTSAVSVDYAVVPATINGVNAADFGGLLPTGTVSFAAGVLSQVITLDVSGDTAFEQDESFTLSLISSSSGAVITNATASGVIRNDDTSAVSQARILAPNQVVRAHLIPASDLPTAIIFRAVAPTTVTALPIGTVSFSDDVIIYDGDVQPIGGYVNGVATAELTTLGFYAVVFPAQASDRLYSIGSSAGSAALVGPGEVPGLMSTNILRASDTNGDGDVTPGDALNVLNGLASQAAEVRGELPALTASQFFIDVNRDGELTPADALFVLNELAAERENNLANQASGEFAASDFMPAPQAGQVDEVVLEESLLASESSSTSMGPFDSFSPESDEAIEIATIDRVFQDDGFGESDLSDQDLDVLMGTL